VLLLEDCGHFNAGRGAARASDGTVELDAALMDGRSRDVGAVAAVRRVPHPISLARLVLERTPHVLLAGPGAEAFAAAQGVALVEPAPRAGDASRAALAGAAPPRDGSGGTVGAVARDADGHLAAGTSTGGTSGKLAGRVGDSPIAGAGTWADDATCAVSGTGQGEGFVRCAFGADVDARIRLAGAPLERACADALARVLALGFSGACIALDPAGRAAFPCSTPAFARGWIGDDGVPRVALLADEPETPEP
jgi:isoaspartyl peptidase/L-asparaginase-like protein (Ntn-hydrolase superfamily)